MRYRIKQYLTNMFVNGILMSFFIPPTLRSYLLRIYTWGGVKGVVQPHCIMLSNKLTLGQHSYINRRCLIDNGQAMITIGENVAVACDVSLLTTNHDYDNPLRRAGKVNGQPITIEHGCWIGAGATILPGTIIHTSTIVGAGSVAKGELDAHSIYAGIPAKKIRSLNCSE